MSEQQPQVTKTVYIGGKPFTRRVIEGVIELGFAVMAIVVALVFFMVYHGWIAVAPSVGLLLLAAWCPFFWGKYWLLGHQEEWYKKGVLIVAGLETGLTILAAILLAV